MVDPSLRCSKVITVKVQNPLQFYNRLRSLPQEILREAGRLVTLPSFKRQRTFSVNGEPKWVIVPDEPVSFYYLRPPKPNHSSYTDTDFLILRLEAEGCGLDVIIKMDNLYVVAYRCRGGFFELNSNEPDSGAVVRYFPDATFLPNVSVSHINLLSKLGDTSQDISTKFSYEKLWFGMRAIDKVERSSDSILSKHVGEIVILFSETTRFRKILRAIVNQGKHEKEKMPLWEMITVIHGWSQSSSGVHDYDTTLKNENLLNGGLPDESLYLSICTTIQRTSQTLLAVHCTQLHKRKVKDKTKENEKEGVKKAIERSLQGQSSSGKKNKKKKKEESCDFGKNEGGKKRCIEDLNVDTAALVHMTDNDIKALGIPMDSVVVSTRRTVRPPKKGYAVQRSYSRTIRKAYRKVHLRLVSSKPLAIFCRQRQDDKWDHDLYKTNEPRVANPKVGARDLRLKLQRKNNQSTSQAPKVRDLHEKLSWTMTSQPKNVDPPKPETNATKRARKNVAVEASESNIETAANVAPQRKSQQKVDTSALVHMTDNDIKALGIPMDSVVVATVRPPKKGYAVVVATVRSPKKGYAVQRSCSCSLTSVHDAILEDLVNPAEDFPGVQQQH